MAPGAGDRGRACKSRQKQSPASNMRVPDNWASTAWFTLCPGPLVATRVPRLSIDRSRGMARRSIRGGTCSLRLADNVIHVAWDASAIFLLKGGDLCVARYVVECGMFGSIWVCEIDS